MSSAARQPEEESAAIEMTAVKILAAREHSCHELRRKLARRFGLGDALDEVLDGLQQRGLLSDQRFVETYIDQRSRKGFGPLRIRAELNERGVSSDLVEGGLDLADTDWLDLLVRTATHKFGDSAVEDRREMARRGRFLEQRGFPLSLVYRYLDQVRQF